MPAKLLVSMRQHRHILAVSLRQGALAVHVHYVDMESKAGLQCLQARDHFLAKMTVAAAIDDQPNFHWDGTVCRANSSRGEPGVQ